MSGVKELFGFYEKPIGGSAVEIPVVGFSLMVSVGTRLLGAVPEAVLTFVVGVLVNVKVFDAVEVVGALFVRGRRVVGATLICSAANCICVYVKKNKRNYSPSGTSGLFFPTRISKYPPRTTRETWRAILSCR